MNPTHDPLIEYFDSLREVRLSPAAEARLRERHVGRFALVATPLAAMALTYAFLLWCASIGQTNVPDVGSPMLEQQMAAAGLLPEGPVETSTLSGRGV